MKVMATAIAVVPALDRRSAPMLSSVLDAVRGQSKAGDRSTDDVAQAEKLLADSLR
jgi:hypothetical protein